MTVTKATFARMDNVSRAAVTLAVKSGALVANKMDMIDDQDPTNAAWLARRAGAKPGQRAAAVKPKPAAVETKPEKPAAVSVKPEKKPEPEPRVEDRKPENRAANESDDGSTYEDMGALSIAKMRADIRLRHEQSDAALQKRLERLGELVDRDLVARAFAMLASEIKVRFVELPARATAGLVAMVRAGRPETEVQKYLEDEIARALIEIKAKLKAI